MNDLLSDPDVASDYIEKAEELERLRRIERCEMDTLQFAIEYFSEAGNPGNDGNWDGFDVADKSESPEFHKEINEIMSEVSSEKVNAQVAVAAPRSHAKSSYLSKAFPIHQIVYRLRKYVMIISETPTVSKGNMEWVRNQMKYNDKLRNDFGALLSPKDQANAQDNSESFIAWYQDGDRKRQVALVEAASTGQALRGRNWNGSRPDLIVCDDLEDARPGGNASTPEQRANLRNWFSQTVVPLGDPKGERTAIVYMGTTVHFDALLIQVLYHRSDFETRIYRAIIDEPTNADLWEQCRLIYVDRDNPDRKADADAFYKDHEAELLAGSRVLWNDVQPLYKLMKWKWDNGSKAFNTEYMNNPVDEESMIFNPETFTYWDDLHPDKTFNHAEHTISMGVDFAMGKKERGDYSAISVVARNKESGIVYVVDSYGERVKPDAFIEKIVEMTLHWEPDVVAVEAQAAQEFFADMLKVELANAGYPSYTRLKKIFQRTRKELRIEAMLPSVENKTIQFSRKHSLLLEQFERYGQGGHDDLPDSLTMSVDASAESDAVVRTVKRMNRW
ncbi:phage terminase large subunit [Virgibacillus halotolerans]|uniref:phage terminase large subunit n=1 Tax=Virgibacillus halotolerans TaxID=1071053 RepID=UPI001EF7785A|nr:phage terminase large subunit [Virgibacillus halotolerans]